MESFYPEEVTKRSRSPRQAGIPARFDARGTGVSLECGVSVRMYLSFSDCEGRINDAGFASNGCGWTVASADVIAEKVSGASLQDLHALEGIREQISCELGEVPAGREHCVQIGLEALRNALAAHREKVADEWTGEKALICSCFGISEETIEVLVSNGASTVETVGDRCGAGTGCGSCQMLIRDIIETAGER